MVTTVIAVATLLLTIGCASIAPSNTPARDIAVRDSLVAIIETWNTAWEPQRMSEDAAVRVALAPFVHDSALTMVIDGTSISGWSSRIPRSMRSHRAATKESNHVTTSASVRLLSQRRRSADVFLPQFLFARERSARLPRWSIHTSFSPIPIWVEDCQLSRFAREGDHH